MTVLNTDQRVLERFKKLQSLGRLGHAYLFVGPKEIGKTVTAKTVAQLVNCENAANSPCGECTSCRKIESGNHPDVMIIEPLQESIKIDQIRTLLGRLQLKAFEAKTKVFIIRNVELMTLEAANSLLKTLEEPPLNTLLILTTSVAEANLDTIRSRCHVIKFFSSSCRDIQKNLECPPMTAQFLTVYTDGCLGQARVLLEDDFMAYKANIIGTFLISSATDLAKTLSGDKEESRQALQILLSVVRDAVLLKTGVPADELMNTDQLKEINQLALRSFEELSAIYEQIVNTRQMLDDNFNTKMAFQILRTRIWGH